MAQGGSDGRGWTWLLAFAAGAATAAALRKELDAEDIDEEDRERLEELNDITEELEPLLEKWAPSEYGTEDEYRDDLFDYLQEHCELEIEWGPPTRVGKPDILVENRLVLECKFMMTSKGERDRAIGQTLTYAGEYDLVWVAMIDTPRRCIEEFLRVLEDHGVEDIAVWQVDSVPADDEDG